MENETKTAAELKNTAASVEAPGASEAVVPEGTDDALAAEQHGPQPEPAAPARTDEASFAVEEQTLPASGARPVVTAAVDGDAVPDEHHLVVLNDTMSRVVTDDDGDRSLASIRKVALWVTLALFLVFPSYWTLGLVVVALASHTSRFVQMVRSMTPEQWGYVAMTLLGGGLRFWDLGLKPLHHDESLHAYYSMQLFQDASTYHYDPLLHGPFQFHAIAYVYTVASHLGVADGGVNDVTARTAAAMLGSAMIPICSFLRRWLGTVGALLASFLLAVSPSFVYYSRFTREDIYFASFTFAMVVAFFKFCEERRLRWLLICVGAFVLSYATKEAAFFTIAIFGGILGGFIAWELGSRYVYPSARVELKVDNEGEAAMACLRAPLGLNEHAGVPALLMYFGLAGILAEVVLNWAGSTSRYLAGADVNGDQAVVQARLVQANQTVQRIETAVVGGLLMVLVAIAVLVLVVLWQLFTTPSGTPGSGSLERRGLARRIDPIRQPLLSALVRIPWAHWFFALLVAFVIFSALFWIVPSNDPSVCPPGGATPSNGSVCSWSQGFLQGIGNGLVQSIYYWIQQQQVARGAQPWYYYLILIPFYEQLIVLFGLGGLARCLARPTRFRLFVVFWFLASLFLYSWASEKMPWLALHMLLPLLLLAAIALDWALAKMLELGDNLAQHRLGGVGMFGRHYGGALLSLVGGVLLLIPMLHTMLFVTFVDPGEAPHEMLSYVQTTPDVMLVMSKIETLDQKLYHGHHLLKIGVDSDNTWPFAWYLRDYSCVGYDYPDDDPTATVFCHGQANTPDVLLITPFSTNDARFFTTPDPAKPHPLYLAKRYRLRAWWDEGYKPLPTCGCVSNPNPLSYGDGLGQWLSYGDTPPPPGKTFDLGKAVDNLWSWLWTRQPIGSADGSTDFLFLVRSGLPMTP